MKILIIGALPKDKIARELYEVLIEVSSKYDEVIGTPIDTAAFKDSSEERYKKAFDSIKDADLLIAEASSPSTGQGMEIRDAILQNKRIIVIAKKGCKVSGLITGSNAINKIIYYDNLNDLKEKIGVVIWNFS